MGHPNVKGLKGLKEVRRCPSCGATNRVRFGIKKNCGYCGNPLESYAGSTKLVDVTGTDNAQRAKETRHENRRTHILEQ